MPIDDAKFKHAMSHFGSGVTVVTTECDGERTGLTVAAFSSLSLHPPLAIVCIERTVRSHDVIATAGKFAVNILASDQADVSNRFASKSEDKFAGVEVAAGSLGLPLIAGAICQIECTLREALPGGDHSIFVGEVVDVHIAEGNPLIYYRGGYRQLAP